MYFTRCGYSLTTLWTAELAHSPFASAPLIADVNGDGSLDITATPFSESMSVIDAQTGKVLSESKWPALNLDNSIYASPLQVYAVDRPIEVTLRVAVGYGTNFILVIYFLTVTKDTSFKLVSFVTFKK